ncbi:hypothetical protein TWF694_005526 [Orbilia ellipsospora]|uniref:Uncharacterized protein n=1 Tax=Orbilia ellipsospora TaxID=2528407 RepID=A0AAV9WVT7_9PEZI
MKMRWQLVLLLPLTASSPLPPGSADPIGTYLLPFHGPSCQLGLWEGTTRQPLHPSWEGYPLGITPPSSITLVLDPTLNNACTNIKDLNPSLISAVSSFAVSGYCQCSFYDTENCSPPSFRFSAFNRQDNNLATSPGGNDNRLVSFSCFYTRREDLFQSCRVALYGIAVPPLSAFVVQSVNKQDLTIPKSDLDSGACIAVDLGGDGEDFTHKVLVSGCSCAFYTATDCGSGLIQAFGNSGTVENDGGSDAVFGGKARVASFRCFYPFDVPVDGDKGRYGLGAP